ncbi:MAG: hypothetical protein OEM16_17350 [Myxococcales bacterium]|nr:hypothetical protein [Myxococcales bacterium]
MWKIRAFWAAATVGLVTTLCSPAAVLAQTVAPSGVAEPANPQLPPEDNFETPYTLGMGAGARAGATGTSALAYNASNMAAVSAYHIEAFSQIIPGGGNTYWTIGSAVTDSTTAKKLALGTGFRGIFSGSERRYKGWDWRTAVGIQVIEQLGVGLGVRWGRMRAESFDGQPLAPTFNGVTLDASMTITPIPWLKVAGLGYNLIKTRSSLAPQMAGGSVSLAPIESVSFGGDILVDLSTFERNELVAGAGVQFIAGEVAPLRAGYRRDSGRNLNQITASAGFNKGKFAIEGALRQTLGSQKESYILIMTRFVVQ